MANFERLFMFIYPDGWSPPIKPNVRLRDRAIQWRKIVGIPCQACCAVPNSTIEM
jgi:hypothetical protein